MSTLLFALWLALEIQGSSTCPTPTEVSQHLARLLPESGKTEQTSRAYLSAGEGFVDVELIGSEGGLVAERRLDRSGSCSEMAEAVAVVLATWQAKFSPNLAPAVNESPAPASPEPPPVVISKPPVVFDVGIAALTSLVDSHPAFGAKLETVLSLFAHGWGFHGSTSLSSSHTQTIASPAMKADMTAEWIRPELTLGPNLRLQGHTLALDFHGDAVLGLLRVKGTGLSRTASDTSAQLGLAAGLRGLWTWTKGAAWFGVDLLGFPGQDNLRVGNVGQVGRLPHLEIQFSLGIALGRFR